MSAGETHDMRAADYVLGLMESAEAEALEARAAHEPALAAAIAEWQTRLAELDDTARAVAPSAALWRRIEDRVGMAAPAPRVARTARPRLWQSLAFWRMAGLTGAVASFVLAAGITTLALRPPPAPTLIAVLLAEGQTRPGAIVEISADGGARLIPLGNVSVPQGQAFEVWTLPSGASAPISIGLLGNAQRTELELGGMPPAQIDQLFEISLEPATGSPTGLPTGPVLFKGTTSSAL